MSAEVQGLVIRKAFREDADAIARVYLESAKHHQRLDTDRYLIPGDEEILARFAERLRISDGVTLVAALDGEAVGFVDVELTRSSDLMHRNFRYCHVVEIAVSPQEQSKGIGAHLLRAAEDWGREQGAEYASLEYLATNVRAAAFYEQRMGYRKASVTMVKKLDRDRES